MVELWVNHSFKIQGKNVDLVLSKLSHQTSALFSRASSLVFKASLADLNLRVGFDKIVLNKKSKKRKFTVIWITPEALPAF